MCDFIARFRCVRASGIPAASGTVMAEEEPAEQAISLAAAIKVEERRLGRISATAAGRSGRYLARLSTVASSSSARRGGGA
jgi:hypothetical protein